MEEYSMNNQANDGAFARNLQFLRKQKNLSQEALAERLEVSRQSVSKWESGMAYPEMNTLLALCGLFGIDLDTLLRGSAERACATDAAGYDAHMNTFAKAMAGGVALVIAGVALLAAWGGLRVYMLWDPSLDGLGAAMLLLCVLAAVMLFIVYGLRHRVFCKRHPALENFYTQRQVEAFESRFVWLVAGPVAAVLAGVVLITVLLPLLKVRGLGLSYQAWLVSLFLLVVGGAAAVLTWAGIQKVKYSLATDPLTPEQRAQRQLIQAVWGAIMLAAAAVYVGFGLATSWGWSVMWWVFPVGAILCGVAKKLLQAVNSRKKR